MWYNPIVRGLLKSPIHSLISRNMMLITYTGRKSGKTYALPVSYLENGEALYTISSRDRVWWRNLRGGWEVTLRLKGRDIPARSESIEEEALVAANLVSYFKTAPQIARYMDISFDVHGNPDPEDVKNLAREKVIVKTELKSTSKSTFAG